MNRPACAALGLAAIALAFPSSARATLADDEFARAEELDAELRFGAALSAYEASLADAPNGPSAERARLRILALRAHSEGDFAPLVELEKVRGDPARTRDAAEIDRLAHDADAFPAGLVRIEAWQLCANANAKRLGREDAALALAERILKDANADSVARTDAARLIADVAIPRGDFARADAAVSTPGALPDLRARVARLHRRHRIFVASLIIVAAWTLVTLLTTFRARRALHVHLTRSFLALTGATAALVALSGLVASAYEGATALPFFILGGGLLIVALGSALSARVLPKLRVARVLASTAALVAIAFLALYLASPDYLEDFRL